MIIMYRILRNCYYFMIYPFRKIGVIIKQFLNFLLPNLLFILSKRVNYKNRIHCNQKTLLTGAGHIYLGENCVFGYKLGGFYRGGSIELQARYKNAVIKIGDGVATNNNVFICAANHIEIGSDSLIGQNVIIMDFEAHGINPKRRRKIGKIGKVILGKNIWIGNNVTILKNSNVGDNSIVAAGAVVNGIFPSNVIIGGVPAKVIREL